MRARWVSQRPSPVIPIVGQAIIASFFPGRFFCVSTIQLDASSPLSKLTRSIKLKVPYNDIPPEPDDFVTQIFRCDKHGWVKSVEHPLFEKNYSNLLQARDGHNEAVVLLSQGKLKLSPLDM